MPHAIYCPTETCEHRGKKPPFEIAGLPKIEGQCTFSGEIHFTWCQCGDNKCDGFNCSAYKRRAGY